MQSASPPLAIALDLGTTGFKLGALDVAGNLQVAFRARAPELIGAGLVREGDPKEFLSIATELIDQAAARWSGVPLGLVSQRSTFTVWNPRSGEALIPMISWQDRRAAAWCADHADFNDVVSKRSGLLLSPHYVGAKLASLQHADPGIGRALREEGALIGTLDAWLIWNWSQRHETDLTMAARTALTDIELGDWSTTLCQGFDVPMAALPAIRPTCGRLLTLSNGLRLKASIADQAAGAVAVLHPDDDAALVNFGTGAFVLSPRAHSGTRKTGYLTGPVLDAPAEAVRFVLEGTINGAGPALDRFHPGPTRLPVADDCSEGFAIPDLAGVGAPHWREDVGLTLSAAAEAASPATRRRVVLEGLLFRVLEILLDLGDGQPPGSVLISGGAVRDPAIGLGLAALLGQPVRQLVEPETTLLGAARLAAGLSPYGEPSTIEISPTPAGAYLPGKYARWHAWSRKLLAA